MMAGGAQGGPGRSDGSGKRPLVIAVTVLTSFDQAALDSSRVERSLESQVETLAAMAQDASPDGVVASPLGSRRSRRRCGDKFLIDAPGFRAGAPAAARRSGEDPVGAKPAAGASYLVIGKTDPEGGGSREGRAGNCGGELAG